MTHPAQRETRWQAVAPCSLLVVLALTSNASTAQRAVLEHAVFNPSSVPQAGNLQGESVAVEGRIAVAGARWDDVGAPKSGVVKIYDTLTKEVLHILENPNPQQDGNFGRFVAIGGGRVAVSARGEDYFQGVVHLYDLNGSSPTNPIAQFSHPDRRRSEDFGLSLALSERWLVIGSEDGLADSEGSGAAFVYDLRADLQAPIAVLEHPDPTDGDAFGGSVDIFGDRVVVGARRDSAAGQSAGRVFVFQLDNLVEGEPLAPTVALTSPSPLPGDWFGHAVAVWGDWVAVGASRTDTHLMDAGRAYLFDLSGDTPGSAVATFEDPEASLRGRFGWSVDVSEAWVVIGSPGWSHGKTVTGGACVMETRTGRLRLRLPRSGRRPAPGDSYGRSVAVSGHRIVIGAPGDDNVAEDAGVIFVYDMTYLDPSIEIAQLDDPSPESELWFGTSLDLSGGRLIVGLELNPIGVRSEGSAYVFDLDGPSPRAPLLEVDNPMPDPSDRFGHSVVIDADRFAVAAPGEQVSPSEDRGAIYLYPSDWTRPAGGPVVLPITVPSLDHYFGRSLALTGDWLAVGEPRGQRNRVGGRVHLYDLRTPEPTPPLTLLENPEADPADFGNAVAVSGACMLVGAPGDDATGSSSGRAYLYDLGGPDPGPSKLVIENPNPEAGARFGFAVSISGRRAVVGAPGASSSGVAFAFDFDAADPTSPITTLTNRSPNSTVFGSSVDISGDWVIVGDGPCAFDLGSARPSEPALTFFNPQLENGFGWAIAVDGETFAIGAPRDNTGAWERGAVYVYSVPQPVPDIEVWGPTPSGTVEPGAQVDYGRVPTGRWKALGFRIQNLGAADLVVSSASITGADASLFTGGFDAEVIIPPIGSHSFLVTFRPDGDTTAGRTATLLIESNDPDENTYEIVLTGTEVAFGQDADGDGFSDAVEALMGFDHLDPSSSFRPMALGREGDNLRVTFRTKRSVGYTLVRGPGPAGPWVLSDSIRASASQDGEHTFAVPLGDDDRAFFRLIGRPPRF